MVTFRLMEKSDEKLVYRYFPLGKAEHGYGIIEVDRIAGRIDVKQLAPDDKISRHHIDERKQIRDAIARMRMTEQLPELTPEEEEQLVGAAEYKYSTVFADHAVQKIVEAYNKGEIIENGQAVWEQ